MLISLDGTIMREVPRQRSREYRKWIEALKAMHGNDAYTRVVDAIRDRIGDAQHINSSWLGSQDWDGTPLLWLWEAVGEHEVLGGFFFGLVVWETLIDDSETWYFYRPENPDNDPEAKKMGMHYWRKSAQYRN